MESNNPSSRVKKRTNKQKESTRSKGSSQTTKKRTTSMPNITKKKTKNTPQPIKRSKIVQSKNKVGNALKKSNFTANKGKNVTQSKLTRPSDRKKSKVQARNTLNSNLKTTKNAKSKRVSNPYKKKISEVGDNKQTQDSGRTINMKGMRRKDSRKSSDRGTRKSRGSLGKTGIKLGVHHDGHAHAVNDEQPHSLSDDEQKAKFVHFKVRFNDWIFFDCVPENSRVLDIKLRIYMYTRIQTYKQKLYLMRKRMKSSKTIDDYGLLSDWYDSERPAYLILKYRDKCLEKLPKEVLVVTPEQSPVELLEDREVPELLAPPPTPINVNAHITMKEVATAKLSVPPKKNKTKDEKPGNKESTKASSESGKSPKELTKVEEPGDLKGKGKDTIDKKREKSKGSPNSEKSNTSDTQENGSENRRTSRALNKKRVQSVVAKP